MVIEQLSDMDLWVSPIDVPKYSDGNVSKNVWYKVLNISEYFCFQAKRHIAVFTVEGNFRAFHILAEWVGQGRWYKVVRCAENPSKVIVKAELQRIIKEVTEVVTDWEDRV